MENILKQALKAEIENIISCQVGNTTKEQDKHFEELKELVSTSLMNSDYFWDFVDTEIREQLEQDEEYNKVVYEEY